MHNTAELKEKYFNYVLTAGGAIRDRTNLDRGIKRHETRDVSTHVSAQPGGRGPGDQMWRFKYLKYWAGAITRTQLSKPVLTGPMSGCILCRYNNNGKNYIAHVGTDTSADTPNTISVKQDWTAYLTSKKNPQAVGRKPTQVITQDDVFAEIRKGGGSPNRYEVWGYFTLTDAWALLIRRGEIFNGIACNKIVLVRPMQLLPWSAIPGAW